MSDSVAKREDCIFCKIVAGEVPSTKVYENDAVCAFEDINPIAPVHVLVVPRLHFDRLQDASDEDIEMMGELLKTAGEVAKIRGVAESGYRVTVNQGSDGGQDVFHLHAHVLGGRQLRGMG